MRPFFSRDEQRDRPSVPETANRTGGEQFTVIGRIRVTIAVVVVVGVLTWAWWWVSSDDGIKQAGEEARPQIGPPIRSLQPSEFLNTSADYVGSEACAECHQDEVNSFARSGMARSMRTVDLETEPPDTRVSHEPSQRVLRSTRRDGKLVHSEEISGGETPWIVGEHEIRYIVGSGAHFSMYLCEIDGFLVESPLTWYTAKPEWAMSPGYDSPNHLGFQREITAGCLFCHAGRATAIDDSYHRIRIDELAIGCERCHGPGSLHIASHSGAVKSAPGDHKPPYDLTIVNPARLDRDRAEAVCHQCHLQSRAYVDPRGRSLADYRPGQALEDFQHYYRSTDPRQQMQVVGHAEQMMLSRCYKASESLTCMTCHNPHLTPDVADRPAHYRRICLACHEAPGTSQCRATVTQRQQTHPADNCIDCHMPTTPTTTLHTAVTHHRIGLHDDDEVAGDSRPPRPQTAEALEPLHDLSGYHPLDRQRSLGLATLKRVFQLGMDSGPDARRLWKRSQALLTQTHRAGLSDSDVDATLAQLLFADDTSRAIRHAASALEDPDIGVESRLNSLYALASHFHSRNRPDASLRYLDQLIQMRRSASDWELRGLCQLQQRKIQAAIASLETAVAIDPELLPAHDLLAQLYDDQGLRAQSAGHRRKVRRLREVFRSRKPKF